MAPEGSRPYRHMGSVEDPSVHDPPTSTGADLEGREGTAAEPAASAKEPLQGDGNPSLPSQPAEGQAATAEPAEDNPPSSEPKPTGHPVRDRLLARAASARHDDVLTRPDAPRPLGSVESELLKVASSRRSPRLARISSGAPLSSGAVMLLGTVFGLAGFALVFALLFEFLPRDPGATESALPEASVAPAVTDVAPAAFVPEPPPRKKIPGPWRIDQPKPGERILRGKIGKDAFLTAIQSAGLQKTQAYRVYTALKGEKDLDHCRPSDEFVALLASDGRVLAFEYMVGREEVYQARQNKDGLLVGKTLDLMVRRARVQGSITIASPSFAQNASASHFDPGLGVIINRALEGHLTVEDFKVGDRLRVVAQEVTVLGEFSRYAGLEALEYVPADGEAIRVYYFENNRRYYDAKGRAPGEASWRRPVPGAPVTSRFNPTRMHPILKKIMPHNGTDFGAPTGTPVFAASSGKIVKLGDYGPNGNFIGIEHKGGYETGYSHLSRFEPGLKVGDTVKRLQPIGYVGSTGRSTGPHLHFSAKKDGRFIDAESLGLDRLTTLPKDQLALFQKVKAKYDELLESVELPPPLAAPVAPGPEASAGEEHLDDFGAEEGSPTPEGREEAIPAATRAAAAPNPVVPNPAVPNPAVPNPVIPNPAPAAVAPPAPAQPRRGSALYMTDQELLQSQTSSDDGEVEE